MEILYTYTPRTGLPKPPKQGYVNDAGFDLFTSRDQWIPPLGHMDLHTDLRVALPEGVWGRITGRSSSVRKGLLVSEGIIDTGFRGELFFGVLNLRPWPRRIKQGTRLAQLILHQHLDGSVEWTNCPHLPPSDRGRRGFGSTGG